MTFLCFPFQLKYLVACLLCLPLGNDLYWPYYDVMFTTALCLTEIEILFCKDSRILFQSCGNATPATCLGLMDCWIGFFFFFLVALFFSLPQATLIRRNWTIRNGKDAAIFLVQENTPFFFLFFKKKKDIFYKNITAEICEMNFKNKAQAEILKRTDI